MVTAYYGGMKMNFVDYFNQMQNLVIEEKTDEYVLLEKEHGQKYVTYQELEGALSTVARNTAFMVENYNLMQDINLKIVLKKLKDSGTIKEELEKEILKEFKNIESLMEDETYE